MDSPVIRDPGVFCFFQKRLFLVIWYLSCSCFTLSGQAMDTTLVLKSIDSLLARSNELIGRNEYDSAHTLLRQCNKLATTYLSQDHIQLGHIKHRIGLLHYYTGKTSDAKLYYLEALRIKKKRMAPNDPSIAVTLNNLGIIYQIENDYAAAEKSYLEARAIWGDTLGTDHERYGWVQHNLGKLYEITSRDEEALVCLTDALRIKQTILDPENPELGHTMSLLASIHQKLGHYDAYETYTIRSAEIWKKQKGINDLLYYWSRHNLANLHEYLGNYTLALTLEKEALSGKESILEPDDRDIALSLITMANIYGGLGDTDSSLICLQRARWIYEQQVNPGGVEYAWVLNNLGLNAINRHDYTLAVQYLRQSLNIKEKEVGTENLDYSTTVINYANALIKTGDVDSAQVILNRQKQFYTYNELETHRNYVYCLELLSDIALLRGDSISALSDQHEINRIHQSQVRMVSDFTSEQELLAYIRQGEKHLSRYLSLACSMETLSEIDQAFLFNLVLFYKGFVLEKYMTTRNQIAWNPASGETYRLLVIEKRKLAEEYGKLLSDRNDVKPILEEINRLEKELARNISLEKSGIPSWDQIQGRLKSDEAVIEFTSFSDDMSGETEKTKYAAVITTSSITYPLLIPLSFEDSIITEGSTSSANSKDLVYALYEESNLQLYQSVWKPLMPYLTGIMRIYYAPAGLLHRVNFTAIPSGQGQVLGDQYTLIRLLSSRQLIMSEGEPPAQKACVLMGAIQYEVDSLQHDPIAETANFTPYVAFDGPDPGMRGTTWYPLKGSEKEINAIFPLFSQSGYSPTLLTGIQATEENFKHLSRSSVRNTSPYFIHLSTHGYFFPDPRDHDVPDGAEKTLNPIKWSGHPMIRSGLILAGGNYAWEHGRPFVYGQDDGILTAYEISLLDLSDTELVVLSACETGLGDIVGNEGVYGLQRAFKIAGVKNLMMTLWQIPDDASATLMIRFYKAWLEEGLSLREALRNAQREMRDEGWDPYYWAGFVLIE